MAFAEKASGYLLARRSSVMISAASVGSSMSALELTLKVSEQKKNLTPKSCSRGNKLETLENLDEGEMMFLRPNCRSKDSQETPPLVEYAPAYSLNKLYEKNPQRLSVIRRWVKGTYLWITCKLPRRPKTIVYCIVFLNSHGLPELSSLRDPAFFLFLAAPLGCEYKSRKSRARFPQ